MCPDSPDNLETKASRRVRRSPSVAAITEFLEYLAPSPLASPEEPYGLQIGSPTDAVKTAVLAPMPTFDAVSTAAAHRNALLITAAPLITEPMCALRRDDPIGERVCHLVERRVALYVLPNSFAAAPGGFDDSLAERLGIAATSVLRPTAYEQLLKIAVPTPPERADAVMQAAAEAGAGHIGKYSHCSFQIPGTGTFLPCEGARPAIGEIGKLERTPEIRIEMVVQQRELQGVIAAILDAHPYEEVAYDVYALSNPGTPYGRGRIGELPLNVSLNTVLAQVQDALGVKSIRCSHTPDYPISRLAAASGQCDGMVSLAVRAGAGALVVGGASQQDWMLAEDGTTVLIDVGYAASLGPGLQRLRTQLVKTFEPDGVEVVTCA
ncbi:MAG: Nif3-like dinuclear metal center hexameric protein [Chthonomonadales bacterium]|nr:Nif3-like dinuclear metal center hexameric protein [Chthonomonadales bacterium]